MFINVYYYFNTTTNSESKDFFSVFLDQEFDENLNEVDRQMIGKPTVANGYSLMFKARNNSPLQKRHTDHHFRGKMLDFQLLMLFRRSVGVERSECETFLGRSDVLCGRDILLSEYLSALME